MAIPTKIDQACSGLLAGWYHPSYWSDPLRRLSHNEMCTVLCQIAIQQTANNILYALSRVRNEHLSRILNQVTWSFAHSQSLISLASSLSSVLPARLYRENEASRATDELAREQLAKALTRFSVFSPLDAPSSDPHTRNLAMTAKKIRALSLCTLTPLLSSPTTFNKDKPFIRDLSDDAKHYHFPPHVGREEVIQQIFDAWRARVRHPFLVGPTRVGKTIIIKEIARRMAHKEEPFTRSWLNNQGREVMLSNMLLAGAGDLFKSSKEEAKVKEDILDKIMKEAVQDSNTTVLVFDEGHAFFTEKNHSDWGNLMKTRLDRSRPQHFNFTIFATTTYEFEKYVATNEDLAVRARFIRIDVPPLPEEMIIDALLQRLYQDGHELTCSFETLSYLYAKVASHEMTLSDSTSLIEFCLDVMNRAITLRREEITHIGQILQEKITAVEIQLVELNQQIVESGNNFAHANELNRERTTLLHDLEEAKIAKKEKTDLVNKWQNLCRQIEQLSKKTKEMMQSIDQIAKIEAGSIQVVDPNKKQLLELLVAIVLPALKKEKDRIGERLGHIHIIDLPLIDRAIRAEFSKSRLPIIAPPAPADRTTS